ncbi:hypothetical protein D1007_40039 [Hordeum vulgare]|nr:hypothetical protein D1007_40039 [Hordeum vulgare]
MRKMDLMVVYTNDPVMVEDSINTMEWLLAEDDKYKVVGFDLAYTGGRVGHDPKVVVTQLCVHHHVLLYHYFLDTVPCECFTRFVNSPDYSKMDMDSYVDMAEAIIDPYYGGMRAECKKNKAVWHMASVKRLDEHHLHTTTKEAYTCYEMFRRIVDRRNRLLPEYIKGSSHKQSGGDKCHMK